MPTQAVFYRDADGRQPVLEFIWSELSPSSRHVIEEQIEEMNGLPDSLPPLRFPRTSQVEGALRELRCHSGSSLYRILYRRSGNLFVLLHMFPKGRRTISRGDIELALRRWRDFKQRMDTPGRRGPRPAGEDAP